MSWLQWLQSDSAIRLARTGLPRRVLRHLIFGHDVGVGSRVLDIGCGGGELVRFFDELGIKAAGIATTNDDLLLARGRKEHCEILPSQFLIRHLRSFPRFRFPVLIRPRA